MAAHPRPRRRASAAVATLCLTVLLGACGGSSEADDTAQTSDAEASPAQDALLPAAEGNVDYPLTLGTAWGEITIEERPERIVAGDDWEIDLLAALGVTPVGTNDQDAFRLYATRDLQPIESTWSNDEVLYPLEPILATDPDLIDVVGSVDEPDNLEELSAIAPVLGPAEVDGDTVAWEDRLRQLARALDLTDRAEQVIADNEQYFADQRAEHPEFEGTTVAFLNFWGSDYGTGYLSTPGAGSTVLFEQLGFADNPDAARFADTDTISDELLGSIEADLILVNDGVNAPDELRKEILDNPLFQSLDAVEAGRVVVIANPDNRDISQDGEVVLEDFGHLGRALGGSGPVPQQAIVDFLVPLLSDALAG